MHDLTIGEHDVLSNLRPDSLTGALLYLLLFVVLALLLSRGLRAAVHVALTRHALIEHTTAVAAESVGEHAVNGCFVTRIEPSAAVLELRLRAPDAASRDSLRSELLQRLARRIAQADAGATAAEPVSFS
jgi:hypothetical protein